MMKTLLVLVSLLLAGPVLAEPEGREERREERRDEGGGNIFSAFAGFLGFGDNDENRKEGDRPDIPEGPSFEGASTLDACRRGRRDFACGECETDLQGEFNDLISQITRTNETPASGDHWGGNFNTENGGMNSTFRDGQPITLESTLARIKDMMKSNNPEGGNGLNYMVIGQSESLQDTSIRDGRMYPRIAIKSPNSELWVTFNTDPTSQAYQTLEIMRWNGLEAKYEFMELDFGNPQTNRPPHVDGTGQRCMACHKAPDPRPNWETYRAWSGIVPSRDDMIEQDSRHGRPVTEGGSPVGMDGRAYLSFLEGVVQAKEQGNNAPPAASDPARRLALLDIPIDERVQFRGRTPAVSSLPPRAQLDAIREQVSRPDGFYRIPHFPYKGEGGAQSNFDVKTAQYAGPSQFAFDQMSGQNFCRISQRMMERPDYDKFRWVVAGIVRCGASSNLESWIPENYQESILAHFRNNPSVHFNDLAASGNNVPARRLATFPDMMSLMNENTTANFARANGFKRDRHGLMGAAFLREVEGQAAGAAQTEAEFFASQFTAPMRYGFHAIGDDGGVNGVGDGNGDQLSALRAVLEPIGIDVGQWSMMRGPASQNDYDSLSFSDQFVLLREQRVIQETMQAIESDPLYNQEGRDSCSALRAKSNQALATLVPTSPPPAPVQIDSSLTAFCQNNTVMDVVAASPMLQVLRSEAEPRARELFLRCARCHNGEQATLFEGLETMTFENGVAQNPWPADSWERLMNYIQTGVASNGSPMAAEMMRRLQSHSMPVNGWNLPSERTLPAEEKRRRDGERRRELASYIQLTSALSDPAGLQQLCNSVNSDQFSLEPAVFERSAPASGANNQ